MPPELASPYGGTKVDRKLAHLVKKMMNPNDTSPPNTDYVVTILRAQHSEYLLKNAFELRREVEACIAYLMAQKSTAKQSTEQQKSSSSSRKRRSLDREEEAYDAAATKEEAAREGAGLGGSLNASLRNRYRQQQKQQRKPEVVEFPSRQDSNTKSSAEELQSPKLAIRRKRSKSSGQAEGDIPAFMIPVPRPTERYADLGGLSQTIQELRELVEYPLLRPELYRHLGIDPPRGVLLRGPPGTGKTHLANAVAGELGVDYFRVSAPELVSGMSGESEGRIRDLFQAASDAAPSIIFLDEIDAVAPKRTDVGSTRGMEKRMVAQLLTSMDAIAPNQNRENAAVIVLAATNRADSLDSALRRAGRFDREILLGVPDEEAREHILRAMTSGMRLAGDFDFNLLARKTPGFVGADVRSLSKEAAVLAINRIFREIFLDQTKEGSKSNGDDGISRPLPLTPGQMEPLYVTMDDFLRAIPSVQPSSTREGFATVPDVSWDDIGGLQSIREELTISVLEPIRNPEKFKALGLTLPAGVLLYGPPGSGKTLLAKAIANESGANFICVKGPELLDKYVGESERAVRLVFERARASSPCVVFFDELDSLVPKRGSDAGGGSGVSERVVNQLLTEMDGLECRRSVFVIAATNRPELIDPAMMRPGRLDKLLYVPLPPPEDRASILKALSRGIRLGEDVDLKKIAFSSRATGYSGADCAALLREAGLAVIKEDGLANAQGNGNEKDLRILSRHFDEAFKAVLPSVSRRDQKRYDRIRQHMASARSRAVADDVDKDDDGTDLIRQAEEIQSEATNATGRVVNLAPATNGSEFSPLPHPHYAKGKERRITEDVVHKMDVENVEVNVLAVESDQGFCVELGSADKKSQKEEAANAQECRNIVDKAEDGSRNGQTQKDSGNEYIGPIDKTCESRAVNKSEMAESKNCELTKEGKIEAAQSKNIESKLESKNDRPESNNAAGDEERERKRDEFKTDEKSDGPECKKDDKESESKKDWSERDDKSKIESRSTQVVSEEKDENSLPEALKQRFGYSEKKEVDQNKKSDQKEDSSHLLHKAKAPLSLGDEDKTNPEKME